MRRLVLQLVMIRLLFDHTGYNTNEFRVAIDDVEVYAGPVIEREQTTETWTEDGEPRYVYNYRLQVPNVAVGQRRVKVSACNVAGCGVTEATLNIGTSVIPGQPTDVRITLKP